MRLPILKPRGGRELVVHELFGGMNLRDSVSMVNDNQLTDCLNMWQQDGTLKTRPAIFTDTVLEIPNKVEANVSSFKTFSGCDVCKHNIFKDGQKGKLQLCSAPCADAESVKYIKIYFLWVGADGIDYEALTPKEFSAGNGIESYFVVEKDGALYLYTNNQQIFKYTVADDDTASWVKLSEEDYYAPLVLAHCTSQLGNDTNESHVMSAGTMIEGFNIISPYYRMSYSLYSETNAKEKTVEGETFKYCVAKFDLIKPVGVAAYKGKIVKLEYTYGGTTYTHKITLNGTSGIQRSTADERGYRLFVNHKYVMIVGSSDDSAIEFTEGSGEDNVIITAPYLSFNEKGLVSQVQEKKRVFSMTKCEWFGGDSAGLAGGTRLFLCGNRNSKLKGLVTWSGLNDPTYFPENSYFYVGNSTERVTGFGKQQDMLVIFKENETWYTQYQRNTDITAEDLINQLVVDYTASSVYFTLTQINPNVGCPYPESVQLCRNRLVWLGYNGAVHTLVSNNQYNERSIYTVSEMVQRKLKDETGKSSVSSADWNGYYCLSFGNSLYLMDYNCYGFNYISSYSKTEDANIQIPWYYWELPDCGFTGKSPMICVGENLGFVGYIQEARVLNDEVRRSFFNSSLAADERQPNDGGDNVITPVHCHFTTKLFEFGAPHTRKNVERVNLQLGNNGGAPIGVSLITEGGTEEQEIVLIGNETEIYKPAFVDSKAVFPCIRNVLRFGVKLSCEGQMAIDGMIIKYKFLGGAR